MVAIEDNHTGIPEMARPILRLLVEQLLDPVSPAHQPLPKRIRDQRIKARLKREFLKMILCSSNRRAEYKLWATILGCL